jgi:hypothetical protein
VQYGYSGGGQQTTDFNSTFVHSFTDQILVALENPFEERSTGTYGEADESITTQRYSCGSDCSYSVSAQVYRQMTVTLSAGTFQSKPASNSSEISEHVVLLSKIRWLLSVKTKSQKISTAYTKL